MIENQYLKGWEKLNRIQLVQQEMKEIQMFQKFIFQQYKKMAQSSLLRTSLIYSSCADSVQMQEVTI